MDSGHEVVDSDPTVVDTGHEVDNVHGAVAVGNDRVAVGGGVRWANELLVAHSVDGCGAVERGDGAAGTAVDCTPGAGSWDRLGSGGHR